MFFGTFYTWKDNGQWSVKEPTKFSSKIMKAVDLEKLKGEGNFDLNCTSFYSKGLNMASIRTSHMHCA
jgi:hypothetical protein